MRHKIKDKYLKYRILSNNDDNNNNILLKIENSILKTLFSFGLIFLLLIWVYIPLTGISILGLNYNNFSDIGKVIFMLVSDFLFLVLLLYIYRDTIRCDFKNFFNKDFGTNFKISLKYWGIGIVIMLFSNYIISIVMDGKLAVNEETLRELIKIAPWYMAFELMIYAPLSEELIFRKNLRNVVNNRYVYAIISGIIFGGLHAITSFNSLIDLLYFIPYCSLGICFGLLYSKTNNIFSTISVHAIHNTLALLLYLI